MTPALWYPPNLPGIGQSVVLWNTILSHSGEDIPLSNDAYFSFEPAEAPDDSTTCTQLRLDNGSLAYIIWHEFPFSSLFNVALTVEDFPTLPLALRDALIEGIVDFIYRALPRDKFHLIAGIRSADLSEFKDQDSDSFSWFKVRFFGLAPEPIVLTFGCKREQLLSIVANISIMPLALHLEAKNTVTVPATFTLGSIPMAAQELQRLTTGTVILLPAEPQERRLLRIGKTLWVFCPTSTGWTLVGHQERLPEKMRRRRFRNNEVTEQVNPDSEDSTEDGILPSTEIKEEFEEDIQLEEELEEKIQPEEADNESEPDTLMSEEVSLSQLPITVDFDIGERDFSLAEIETWQSGSVVELDPPMLAGQVSVTLRTNGRTIAIGDLVCIDDRLAVRLSKVLLCP